VAPRFGIPWRVSDRGDASVRDPLEGLGSRWRLGSGSPGGSPIEVTPRFGIPWRVSDRGGGSVGDPLEALGAGWRVVRAEPWYLRTGSLGDTFSRVVRLLRGDRKRGPGPRRRSRGARFSGHLWRLYASRAPWGSSATVRVSGPASSRKGKPGVPSRGWETLRKRLRVAAASVASGVDGRCIRRGLAELPRTSAGRGLLGLSPGDHR
jgi:hypothetical protein